MPHLEGAARPGGTWKLWFSPRPGGSGFPRTGSHTHKCLSLQHFDTDTQDLAGLSWAPNGCVLAAWDSCLEVRRPAAARPVPYLGDLV